MKFLKYFLIIFIINSCKSVKFGPEDKEFYKYLENNYQTYADYKLENYDYRGAKRFYDKVREIRKGNVVSPENIYSTTSIYNYFSKNVTYEQFFNMRERMNLVLINGVGKSEYAEELANLQFFFDCWTTEEGMYTKFSQPIRCKQNFIETLEYLELKLMKVYAEEKEYEWDKYRYNLKRKKKKYALYFDFDSSVITERSSLVIWELLKDIENLHSNNYTLYILGHADRVGTKDYNKRLSHRRSKTVIHYLVKNGVPIKNISTKWQGELDPQIITKNEFKEELNRRVVLVLESENDISNN